MGLNTLHPTYESTVKKAFTNNSVSFHSSSGVKLGNIFGYNEPQFQVETSAWDPILMMLQKLDNKNLKKAKKEEA